MIIYLIRHALSAANCRREWTGQRDSALSDSGVAELASIMERFEYPEADFYFCSPLRRCTDTLRFIYRREPDLAVPGFMECSLGTLEGRPYTNLNDDRNYLAWIESPDRTANGGESFNAFRSRCEYSFAGVVSLLTKKKVRAAAGVMHGNVMRAILCRYADVSVPHSAWKIPNCGFYELDIDEKNGEVRSWKHGPEFLFK